ncbi:TolC family protein [Mucilaginibacter sp. OK283]|jgi:outer membrane protein TolC|uniref:TolC family protein n=1 Tax=Mucilaginibacter sp. OK283 TaxID=1881049 RepID=UPI0008BDACEA|nr:TolC family protein [Mucilaginibacter sp. OK283]SEP40432.1 Outer membrane protein TolC [Mucilaginibacter sp. OK283]
MKIKIKAFVTGSFIFLSGSVHAQKIFTSVDSLLNYSVSKSISVQSGYIRLDQAKKAKLAAILSVPDPTGNTTFSYTHNTKLPVSLFPSEAFGGQAGTYKEVQTGVPYVTNFSNDINIKLFNLTGWENLKMSKLNIESNASENKLTLKELWENIATSYYNIVSLQEQLTSTVQNVAISDSLLAITKNKYNAGLIKQQDVNDANVNNLTTRENKNQIEYLIKQQYLALKILCDIPEKEDIQIANKLSLTEFDTKPFVEYNNVAFANSVLKEKIALSNWKQQKYSKYPALSFFQSSTSQQNNTSGKLFDSSVKWYPSSYIGLKLSIPFPSSNTMSQTSKAKYDYLLAQKNTEQQKIKSDLQVRQIYTDYDKALSQATANKEIYLLRKENYQKYLNLYTEGQASLEQTLNKFNEMVSSHYNLVSSQVTVLNAKTKIDINNRIK